MNLFHKLGISGVLLTFAALVGCAADSTPDTTVDEKTVEPAQTDDDKTPAPRASGEEHIGQTSQALCNSCGYLGSSCSCILYHGSCRKVCN